MRIRAALSALLLLTACSRPVVVRLPADQAARATVMLDAVQRLGQPGDWLVVRGVHATDDFVSAATNAPFSHAAVLDLERGQVIEAEGKGLHTTPLAAFMAKSQRLMLVRPMWAVDATAQNEAVAKARALVGSKYDFTGLVGINVPDRYYCSELAVAVYGARVDRRRDHIPPVIPPDQLPYWGTVIWDSGPVFPER